MPFNARGSSNYASPCSKPRYWHHFSACPSVCLWHTWAVRKQRSFSYRIYLHHVITWAVKRFRNMGNRFSPISKRFLCRMGYKKSRFRPICRLISVETLLNRYVLHVVISLLLQGRKFWWYILLSSSILLHDVYQFAVPDNLLYVKLRGLATKIRFWSKPCVILNRVPLEYDAKN